MFKCDKRAFSRCKYKESCGPDAEYEEGSECEKFNKIMLERPMTNADCIRSMNDEELEDQLVLEVEGIAPCKMFISIPTGEMFISRKAAKESVGNWLKQPLEEE